MIRQLTVVIALSALVSFATVRAATITITCDNDYDLYVNGTYIGSQNNSDGSYGWDVPESWTVNLHDGLNVLAVHGRDHGGAEGLIAEVKTDQGHVYVTDASWKTITTEDVDWTSLSYDDTMWDQPNDLGPYDSGPWTHFAAPIEQFSQNGARWIWPTVHDGQAYFRKAIVVGDSIEPPPPPPPPPPPSPGTIVVTCDNDYELYLNGTFVGAQNNADGSWGWDHPETWQVVLEPGDNIIAVSGINWEPGGGGQGLIAAIYTDDGAVSVTDATWKVATSPGSGWTLLDYDDSGWDTAFDQGSYDQIPWTLFAAPLPQFAQSGARWIWHGPLSWHEGYGYLDPNGTLGTVYFRKVINNNSIVPVQEASWGAIKALFQ